MARIRTIKPDFALNPELARLSAHARLFFILLWTHCDREGRCEDRPQYLWARIFPYEPKIKVENLLRSLSPEFIIRYEVGGKKYIQVKNFLKHQLPHYKEVASVIPKAPGHKDSGYNASSPTEEDREFVFNRDGNKCKKCGAKRDLTIDHIVPRSFGGGSERSNLQVLCRSCNSAKSNRMATSVQGQADIGSSSAKQSDALAFDNGNPLSVIGEQQPQAPSAVDFSDYRVPFGKLKGVPVISVAVDECEVYLRSPRVGGKFAAALRWRISLKAMEKTGGACIAGLPELKSV